MNLVRRVGLILIGISFTLHGCSAGGAATQDNPELARLEQEMFQAVNHYRDSIGLNKLEWNEVIAEQARIHSRNMAAGKAPLGHNSADGRADKIGKKIAWESVSENVAYSTRRTDIIPFLLNKWLISNGHRKNIEGDFTLSGMGAAVSSDGRYFFTQIFLLTK